MWAHMLEIVLTAVAIVLFPIMLIASVVGVVAVMEWFRNIVEPNHPTRT